MSQRLDATTLLGRLLGPAAAEVTCDECFELLDEYVEALAKGVDTVHVLPGVDAHLQGCQACHEDFESLWSLVVRPDSGHA